MGSHSRQRFPGLPAWMRRRPGRRPLAVGAVASGAVLFVVASITTPLAGADTTHPAPHVVSGPDLGVLLPLAGSAPDPTVFPAPAPPSSAPRATRPAAPAAVRGLAANGIPAVALNAYRVAAARTDHAEPGCGIDWALLAGIGRVESDHGRFHGAVLHADGTSTPRIIGPALDGIHYTYVPAPPDGMALAGDARYAHALGPMQFIPSTWAAYGADGNGDGVADVFNINDAALGAARYLCAAGGDLRTHDGQVRAVLAYNHVDAYVTTVLALADAYRRGIPVTGLPVGNISGALPPVHQTGTPPPANPGGPTAVEAGARSPSPKPSPSGSRSGSPAASPQPAQSTSTAPAPAPSAPSAPSSSSAPPAPSPTSAAPPSSTPSPSPSCDPLRHLLHLC